MWRLRPTPTSCSQPASRPAGAAPACMPCCCRPCASAAVAIAAAQPSGPLLRLRLPLSDEGATNACQYFSLHLLASARISPGASPLHLQCAPCPLHPLLSCRPERPAGVLLGASKVCCQGAQRVTCRKPCFCIGVTVCGLAGHLGCTCPLAYFQLQALFDLGRGSRARGGGECGLDFRPLVGRSLSVLFSHSLAFLLLAP